MLLYPTKRVISVNPPKFGKGEEQDFHSFLNFCGNFTSNLNVPLLYKAFQFNTKANKDLQRKSGEPFYTHPLEVACFLVENVIYNDELIASALLHDVLGQNNLYSINDIESEFGKEIAKIVESVYRITNLERQEIANIEYFRRLLIALTTDVRIIFIKIADRYIDMKTISYLSPETQRKFAEDTFQVYIPLAHRLGLYNIKSELEDMAFRVLDRDNYNRIVRKLKMTKHERDEYLRKFSAPIIEMLQNFPLLKENDIYFEVHGRVKHIYSIYNKTLLRGKPVEELYDLIGIRIILDTEDETICEKVVNEIKKIYPFIPETYKDYIRNPKPNGYKSIHCAFVGEGNQKVEVQVRTFKMHLIAEKGVAAHYRYKSGQISIDSIFEDEKIEKWIQKIRDLLSQGQEVPDSMLFEGFDYEIFSDEIYVLTPKQEMVILPKDSTVLDFAYYIHTELGHRCAGVKVNGKTCSIFTKLNNGDIVEIIQGSNLEPEFHWLDKVVTRKAKNAINEFFTQKAQEYFKSGKQFFDKIINEQSLSQQRVSIINSIIRHLKYTNPREFFIELGKSQELKEAIEFFVIFLKENNFKFNKKSLKNNPLLKKLEEFIEKKAHFNPEGYTIIMSECCLPAKGDEVEAFLLGKTIIVHRKDCPKVKLYYVDLGAAKVNFDWEKINQENFEIGIKFHSPSFLFVFNLLAQALSSRNDVAIKSWQKQEVSPNRFYWIFYFDAKDVSFINVIRNLIEVNDYDVKFERIGRKSAYQ
ncbi:MAG: RelA/SpoT family protein [Candidatus Kapaibacteriota bacterium]